jgi:hypothetical protein
LGYILGDFFHKIIWSPWNADELKIDRFAVIQLGQ